VSTNLQKRQILAKIRNDKEYRDNFVAEQIYSRLPLKIRNMRIVRRLKQRELAVKAAVAPEWITQVENPNYGRFTLKTLLKIASALDVALYVDFVPYSRIVNDAFDLNDGSLDAPSAPEDAGLAACRGPHGENDLGDQSDSDPSFQNGNVAASQGEPDVNSVGTERKPMGTVENEAKMAAAVGKGGR
jgi:transcriptional regulator with XRE-family HTH domain